MANLSEILKERGFVYQHSSETLEEITDGEKRTVYLGVDPTADSIHVGNLAVYMMLRHFADAGHKVVLLIGGGTALVGDPKPDVERTLTDPSIVAGRAAKLRAQAEKVLGGVSITFVNNADWLTKLNLIEFLRDTGKHFTVNALIKKDAISARLEREDGLSFTEFSYPLLQAYDFWHMYKDLGVDVQIGASDQWGNIIAGVDLIRRKEGKQAYCLSRGLVLDADGKKFGKSEGNAVWLDADKTSPYQFYQFWLNLPDAGLREYFLTFTLLSVADIDAVLSAHDAERGKRIAQSRLAEEVTMLVHGEDEAKTAEQISLALFGDGDFSTIDANVLKKSAPTFEVSDGAGLIDVLIGSQLASSKREAREFIAGGAISLNGEVNKDETYAFAQSDFKTGAALLKRGKRNVSVLVLV